jgi:hypothetical protein
MTPVNNSTRVITATTIAIIGPNFLDDFLAIQNASNAHSGKN